MRIAVDAMGGDHAPDDVVRGALLYREAVGTSDLVLVGDEPRLAKLVGSRAAGIEIVHAASVVEMGEHPATALRRRDDTSIGVATRLVKEGTADAVVSAGNTGATMAAALLILGRVRGIDRPALCGMLPVLGDRAATCLLDAGATMDAEAKNLLQFARMATAFMEKVHRVDRPSIGLMNVGEEPEKGDKLRLETHALLSAAGDLNFYGNIEGRDVLRGVTDIVLCDGFTGNVIAKTLEGALDVVTTGIRRDIFGGPLGKVAGLVAYPGIRAFRHRFDYDPYVSAPLLGIAGVSVVTHGRARANMMRWAIAVAERAVATQLVGAIGTIAVPAA
ncbi:MAG TPA: phosphate acyltransferase PlsX [Candidatus Limnocylindria bacterium]|nr:phosphate acyltransferase PlsX [Candidatus Limnocylindria bacterium]